MKNWMEKNLGRRLLAMVLCLSMVLSMAPVPSFAEGCIHHPEHTAECGYVAAVQGQPCGHTHTDACYTFQTVCLHSDHGDCGYVAPVEEVSCACQPNENGEMVHTEGCGYVPAVAGVDCGHVCSVESGCVTKTLNCTHQHDETCGYVQGVEGKTCTFVCQECSQPQETEPPATPVCSCETKCAEGNATESCQVCAVNIEGCTGKEPEAPVPETCAHGNALGSCETCASEARVAAVQAQIDALPEEVTAETKEAAQTALAAVDTAKAALTEAEQGRLDMTKYTALAEKLAALDKCAHGNDPATCEACKSEARVAEVQALIDALPTVEELTEDTLAQTREQLATVKAAVEALTAEEQALLTLDKYTALTEYFAALDEAAKEPVEAESIVVTGWLWDYDEYIDEASGCMVLPITPEEFAIYLSDEETFEVIQVMLPGAVLFGEETLTLGEWTYESAPEGTPAVEIDGESYYPEGFFKTTLPEGYILEDETNVLSLPLVLIPPVDEENTPVVYDTKSGISYLAWDGTGLTTATCDSATIVTGSDTSWGTAGATTWYVVQASDSSLTISSRITVNGDVHLILEDNCNLTVNGGIQVKTGNSLTIYSQSAVETEMGTLTVQNVEGQKAGIGTESSNTAGTVTINGGIINTTGGQYGAGIGGSYYSRSSRNGPAGTITINGGKVTAIGGQNAAGIGGGKEGDGGNITISGGTVNATGGTCGAGIGGGNGGAGGNITINGGTVRAEGKESAAGIGGGNGGAGGYITINGGEITAIGSTYFSSGGAGIGGGSGYNGGNITIKGGTIEANGGNKAAGIGGGSSGDCGTIRIEGGTITANGGASAAGIGCGNNAAGGTVTITGGVVNATGGTFATEGGTDGGPGIGVDQNTIATVVTISGGTVTANGMDGGAGIFVASGPFSTGENGSAVIFASSIANGYYQTTSSWSGVIFQGNNGQVYGSPILTANATIPAGKTLTIPTGGALTIADGVTLNNQGAIYNNGTISGTVTGNLPEGMMQVTYKDESGTDKTENCNVLTQKYLTDNNNTLNNGWYVARGNFSVGTAESIQRLTVNGDVKLILEDDCNFIVNGGIEVSNNKSLTIYAQSADDNMGKLTAQYVPESSAGIGGSGGSGGTITINGGTITATGGDDGAGIGGGQSGNGGNTTINGGTVTATGGVNAAGVGGGRSGNGGNTTINGGEITAYGGTYFTSGGGAGIGGGYYGSGGSITINGGNVTATGGNYGAGIGGGWEGSGGKITINGGTVTATGSSYAAGIGPGSGKSDGTVRIDGGTVLSVSGQNASNAYKAIPTLKTGLKVSAGGSEDALTGVEYANLKNTTYTGNKAVKTEACSNHETGTVVYKDAAYHASICKWCGTELEEEAHSFVGNGNCVCGAVTVNYLDENGTEMTANCNAEITADYLTQKSNTLSGGWYVVQASETGLTIGTADAPQRVTVNGNVNLILADGCNFTVNGGIQVQGTNSLTIYAQSKDAATMGKLTAQNVDYNNAGIGGDVNTSGGTITINGGVVTARGNDGAGIGGGCGFGGDSGSGGNITINGGTVTASSGSGAGIGGGNQGSGGSITINGGEITANSIYGAGIGGGNQGSGGSITINGGEITANSIYGAGIGGGDHGTGGDITISGGNVTATGGNWAAGIGGGNHGSGGTFSTGESGTALIIASSISDTSKQEQWRGIIFGNGNGAVYGDLTLSADLTIDQGQTLTVPEGVTLTIPEGVTLTNKGTLVKEGTINGTVTGNPPAIRVSYLDAEGTEQFEACTIITAAYLESVSYALPDGWYAVQDTVIIGTADAKQRITVSDEVHLILANGCNFTVNGGIGVNDGNSLTIYEQPGEGTKGILTVQNVASYYAGIGGDKNQSCGTIIITGGTVNANGGEGGAGIGGGNRGSGGSITINGGTVKATGGVYGAGIGGGQGYAGGNITINGGTVNATGGSCGAGIGGGDGGDGGTITINGGTVNATGGNWAAGIGGGDDGIGGGDGGTITITGGNVAANGGEDGAGIGGGKDGTGGSFSTGENGSPVIFASSISDQSGKGDNSWQGIIFEGNDGQVYGNLTLSADLTIAQGQTLTIPEGASLTIAEGVTLTNNGTIVNNGTITNNGTIVNNGTITNSATLTNNGTILNNGTITGTVDGNKPIIRVKYLDADGTEREHDCDAVITAEYLTEKSNTLSAGWYVVKGELTIGDASNVQRITVSGDVHLILANGCNFTVNGGIQVQDNDHNINTVSTNRLTIYAQPTGENMGKLTAQNAGYHNAGIGGGGEEPGGNITINGGNVTAKGGEEAAGIGGGWYSNGGTITINGGTVTANGGKDGAGIGGGWYSNGGNITIRGGTVTATGGSGGAGIGSGVNGSGGTITINGGTVNATGNGGGAGIGGGPNTIASVDVDGGNITIRGGNVTAKGGEDAAGIGGGYCGDGGTIIINGGTVNATGGENGAGIGGGLHIDSDQIGSGGTITIRGGTVTANGGKDGAGIGGGVNGSGGKITIRGGTVNATGNGGGAGIGGGPHTNGRVEVNGGDITISGGTVTATGKYGGAGIGAGDRGTPGTFQTPKEGEADGTAVIYASYISDQSGKYYNSWRGIIFEGNDGQVYGTNVTPAQSFEVPANKNLLIPANTRLTISDGITAANSGKVYMNGGTVSGAFTNTENGGVYYPLTLTNCTANGVTSTYQGKTYAKAGETVTLTPNNADAGKMFTGWQPVGVINEDRSFTMPEKPVSVTAEFADIVASVTVGENTFNFASFQEAFNAANGNTATITLLKDVEISDTLEITGGNVTFQSAVKPDSAVTKEYTITAEGQTDAITVTGGTLNFQSGNIAVNNYAWSIRVNGGTVNITGGTIHTVAAGKGSSLNISGGTIDGLSVDGAETALSGGSFDSINTSTGTVSALLANGHAYKLLPQSTWVDQTHGNIGQALTGDIQVLSIPVSITTQPTGIDFTYGETNKTLSVGANGESISYQWYEVKDGNTSEVTGKTGATYDVSNLNAGSYKYFCRLTCEGYVLDSNTVTVTVEKQTVQVPTIREERPYNGNNQTSGITETDKYTVSEEGGTSAGTYDVTLTLKDPNNFKWSDGTEGADKTLSFKITQATNSWITEPSISDWTYGEEGDSHIKFGTPQYIHDHSFVEVFFKGNTLSGQEYAYDSRIPTDAGNYTADFKVGSTNDYTELYKDIPFKVLPKEITVTITPGGGTYGGTITGATAKIKETLVGNDQVPVTLTYTGTDYNSTTVPTNAGTYTVTASISDSNYLLTGTTTADWKITKAPITPVVTIANAVYGEDLNPSVSGNTGNGEVTYTYYSDAACEKPVTPKDVGTYYVKAAVAEMDNYQSGTSEAVSFQITKKALTVTAKDKTITYGDAPANDGVSYNGFVSGETENVLGGTLAYDYSYSRYDNVGDYTITPKGLTSGNYNITFADGTLTVEQKEIGIDWGNTSLAYTGIAQAPTATATGLVNNDVCAITVTGQKTEAGNYTATAAALSNSNYKLPQSVTTTFSIAKVAPAFTAPTVKELTYSGQAQALVNAGSTGHGTMQYRLGTDGQWSTAVPTSTNAGSYTVWYKVQGDANHLDSEPVSVSCSIAKASLTVTAKDKTITYGDAPANDGVSYNGFVSGETENVLGGNLAYTYSYSQYGDVGNSYTITPKGQTSGNYDITFADGTLTVERKEIGITWGDTQFTYNGSTQMPTATPTGMVNSDAITLTVSGQQTNVGTAYTATVTGITGEKADNYELPTSGLSTQFSITAKSLTVNVRVADKQYDGKNIAAFDGTPTLEGVVGNDDVTLVNGTPTFTSVAVATGIPIAFTDFSITGTASRNYTLTQPNDVTASIYNRYTALEGTDFTSNTGSANANGWLNQALVIRAGEGFQISATNTAEGEWTDKLTVDQDREGTLTFYVRNTQTGAISQAVTVPYKLDTTKPSAEIKFGTEAVTEKGDPKTLYLSSTIQVTITGTDGTSDIGSVSHCLSAEELNDSQLESAAWVSSSSFQVEAVDNASYRVYTKVVDNAGNVAYFRSNRFIFDTTAPSITGVENGKTYYTTQTVTITDTNLKSLTLNGAAATSPITLEGNMDATHIIEATDKAGNTTTYTVYMKTLDSLVAEDVEDVDASNVSKDNKENLEKAKEDLEDQLASATEAEQDTINELLDPINEALAALKNVEAVEAKIQALPDSIQIDDEDPADENAIKAARAAYEALTDHEKTLADISKLTKLESDLVAYGIISGDGSVWNMGSGEDQVFTANGPVRKFQKVELDNEKLDEANYQVTMGSTIVTLNAAFMQTLEEGSHTLAVFYTDGQTKEAKFEVKRSQNYLDLTEEPAFQGRTEVFVDGVSYPIEENGDSYVNLPETGDLMTLYTYRTGAGDYGDYPTGMEVYRINRSAGGTTVTHIPELSNLLQYSGCSIRVTGNRGIRMITSLDQGKKAALTGAGLAGFTLEEYGTVVTWASDLGEGDLNLNSGKHNFAYKRGVADPVFGTNGSLTQYTNVLVGFSLEECSKDIVMRPYIVLRAADGKQYTLYGGTVTRSISYIAWQNRDTYKPWTSAYDYVHELMGLYNAA